MRVARLLTVFIPTMTLALLMLGGYVHAVGASLACPDWPLCYGQLFPPMQGGILWEHSHRLLGAAVGLGIVALAIACWREPPLRGPALLGVPMVMLQGLLGGLTVLYRLPALISIAHLSLAMLVLAWTVFMMFRVRAPLHLRPLRTTLAAPRAGVAAAAGLIYVQIVLGALVRHTQSSMACGTEVFTCLGLWLPVEPRQVVQTLHRVTAIVAGLAVVMGTLPAMAWARRNGRPLVRRLGVLSHTLVLAQWVLGAWVIKTAVHSHVVTLHLGLGAILWGALVAMFLSLGPLGARPTRAARRPAAGSMPAPGATSVSDPHGAC